MALLHQSLNNRSSASLGAPTLRQRASRGWWIRAEVFGPAQEKGCKSLLHLLFALAATSDQYWKVLDGFWPAEEKQLSPEFCPRLLIFICSLTRKKLSYFRCDSSAFSSAPEPLTQLHWHRSQKSLVTAYIPPVPRRTEMKTTTFKDGRWTESQPRANELERHLP